MNKNYTPVNKSLDKFAKQMRKNQTDEERKIRYNYLIKIRPRFHRQKIIGNYIVDFYCPQLKIIIEIDGVQHYEKKNAEYDLKRTAFLESQGYSVVRFDNCDVNRDYYGVVYYIREHCKTKADMFGVEVSFPEEL